MDSRALENNPNDSNIGKQWVTDPGDEFGNRHMVAKQTTLNQKEEDEIGWAGDGGQNCD